MASRLAALAAVLLAAGGCTSQTPRAGGSDSGPPDAPVLPEGVWTAGGGWTIAGVPDLQIGVLSGDDAYQFQRISAATVLPDGSVVVADAGTGLIRRYDSAGRYLSTLGGPGDGPGEFRSPAQLSVGSGGQLTVWDPSAWRATRFDAQGRLLGVESFRLEEMLPFLTDGLYPGFGWFLGPGEAVFPLVDKGLEPKAGEKGEAGGSLGGSPGPGDYARTRSGVFRFSLDTSQGETLARMDGDEVVMVDAPWGLQALTPPLGRGVLVAPGPTGERFCAGDQSSAVVTCWDRGGGTVEVTWDAAPRPLQERAPEVQLWRDTTAALYGQKLSARDARQLVDAVPVPEVRPPYAGLLLDTEGNLWVELGPGPLGGVDHLVFDPRGVLLGSVTVPELRLVEVARDYVLGVHTDELGVDYLRRYPLDRSSPSPAGDGDPPASGA